MSKKISILGWPPSAMEAGVGKRGLRAAPEGVYWRVSASQPQLESALSRFGLATFRPGQREVIERLMAGKSVLAVFPTGGGKSLCYQLPALLLDGVTLVVSPLIALMKDQVDALQARGIGAARFDSTLSQSEAAAVWRGLDAGELDLLYVAPERLANAGFRERLGRYRIALLAVDEAHCISEWGHNFRPDYLKLVDFGKELGVDCTLGLTATATPQVSASICERFGIAAEDHVQLSFRRGNLAVAVTPCTAAGRKGVLLERLRAGGGAAVVYVTLQATAEAVATYLSRNGIDAKAYHAGLRDDYRAALQERFMAGEVGVVVATIAFGMGIDKADIRAVYHYNLPKSLENYVQEIGRAGRDGLPARCELLACADDLTVLENFTYGDTPTAAALRALADRLLRQGEAFDISRYELSTVNDIRPQVIATVLTYLELGGVLAATAPFYNRFRIQFLRDEAAVLAGYDPGQQDLLRRVFAAAKRWKQWLTVVVDEVAAALGEDPEQVRRALGDMEAAGDAIAKPSGLRQGYRLVGPPPDIAVLGEELQERFRLREAQDIARLRRVVEFAEADGCRTRALLEYFGESLADDCGDCDGCRGEATPGPLPRAEDREMSATEVAAAHALVAEHHPALRSPRQVARFLCGLSSPAATRAKLTRHDSFGLLGDIAFLDVLLFCEALNLG